MRRDDGRVRLLISVLNEAFVAKGWQGATLRGSLRGLGPREALWRPGPGRHNIWELVLHTAYWKHVVRQRVAGGGAERFPRGPRNYPDFPARCDTAAWKADLALLERAHRRLVATVRALPPARLEARVGKSRWTVVEQVFGVAAHDLYHTGQIQLLKVLRNARGR